MSVTFISRAVVPFFHGKSILLHFLASTSYLHVLCPRICKKNKCNGLLYSLYSFFNSFVLYPVDPVIIYYKFSIFIRV